MAPVMIKGVGYWSGRDVKVEFCPAPADTGIVFVRRDLPGSPRIAARIENRTETPLRTTLCAGDVERGNDRAPHVGLGGNANRQLRNSR